MFEYPEALWLFILIPFIFIAFFWDIFLLRRRTKKIATDHLGEIMPNHTEGQRWVRTIFYTAAFICFILTIARPKWGYEEIQGKVFGRDIMFLIDVSYSMTVSDIPPSRFELIRKSIISYIDSGISDRVGIMVFSSDTELVVPLTTDYESIQYFMQNLYPGMTGTGGTDIRKALESSVAFFKDQKPTEKMIVLITDGEDLATQNKTDFKFITDSHIKVFTVGVGTTNGQPVPVRNEKGEIEKYLRDSSGQPVISRLDEDYLKKLAQSTGGLYHRATMRSDNFNRFIQSIDDVEKSEKDSMIFKQRKDRYPLFLIPGLLLIFVGLLLDFGKLFPKRTVSFFYNSIFRSLVLFLGLMFLTQHSLIAEENKAESVGFLASLLHKNDAFHGNRSYKKSNYEKSLKSYSQAIYSFSGDSAAKLLFNIANALYKNNDYENAIEYYKKIVENTNNPDIKASALYNMGISTFKNKKYDEAKKLFKSSLLLIDNDDTRYNYEIASLFADNKDDDEKDENEDENQDENEDKEEKQQDKNKDNQDQNKQSEGQKQSEDYEKMLDALQDKENNNQRNMAEQIEKQQNNSKRGKYW